MKLSLSQPSKTATLSLYHLSRIVTAPTRAKINDELHSGGSAEDPTKVLSCRSQIAGPAVDELLALVRRSECVPKNLGSRERPQSIAQPVGCIVASYRSIPT